MKPPILRLSLLVQGFKKMFYRGLYEEAVLAQKVGNQIFEIEILFLLNGTKESKSEESLTARIGKLGEYDWRYDVMTIFHNQIRSLCIKYGVDYKSTFLFCFCHEMGHAREQRLFEEIGVFPNVFKILHEGVPIKIESKDYVLGSMSIWGKKFFDLFSGGIYDFAIDKELSKHGVINKIARRRFFDSYIPSRSISGSLPKSNDLQRHHYMVLERLLLLPQILNIYEHGELLETERRKMEEMEKRVIGDKWEIALRILEKIEFFRPEETIKIVCRLFEETLGCPAFLVKEDKKTLFRRYSSIPNFWNKEGYKAIHL